MKRYLKLHYVLGFIAMTWVFTIGLIVLVTDNLAGPLDLLIRSVKVTGLLLMLPPLGYLTFYGAAWCVLLPIVGALALGNYLHRSGSRYARLVTKYPVDLDWPIVRDILFHARFPRKLQDPPA